MNRNRTLQKILLGLLCLCTLSSCLNGRCKQITDKRTGQNEKITPEKQTENTAEWDPVLIQETEGERIVFTEEEAITAATHIVIAELLDVGERYLFHVEQILKANSDIENDIHVMLYPHAEGNEPVKGNRYLLFLERNIAVFYEYDLYGLFMECLLIDSQEKAEEMQEKIDALADSNTAPAYYGNHFTTSTDIGDILDESFHIVRLRVINDGIKSEYYQTLCCGCIVTDVMKGDMKINESIQVTFFVQDQVQVGQEYVVFLAECKESAPIYTLSSKNSVYKAEEGERILKKYLP